MSSVHARLAVLVVTGLLLVSDARTAGSQAALPDERDARKALLARAPVWQQTNIPSMDIRLGPFGPGAFPFRATVNCTYLDKKLSGMSPKFACMIGNEDEVKVKYGGTNGEVYAEVAA